MLDITDPKSDDIIRAALSSAPTLSDEENAKRYWLIERDAACGCEWWVKGSVEHQEWTTDASRAQHFTEWGANHHAKELMDWGIKGNLRATEHINCNGPERSDDPKLPCMLIVGASHFHAGASVSTAQSCIDRLYARMRELEPPLTAEQRAQWKDLTGIEPIAQGEAVQPEQAELTDEQIAEIYVQGGKTAPRPHTLHSHLNGLRAVIEAALTLQGATVQPSDGAGKVIASAVDAMKRAQGELKSISNELNGFYEAAVSIGMSRKLAADFGHRCGSHTGNLAGALGLAKTRLEKLLSPQQPSEDRDAVRELEVARELYDAVGRSSPVLTPGAISRAWKAYYEVKEALKSEAGKGAGA